VQRRARSSRPDYRRLRVSCDQSAAIPHTVRMGMMTQLLERLGFVRLRDYGLILTPDRRVVPMDVAPPPEPFLFVTAQPEPIPFVAAPPEPIVVAQVATPMAEPDDDWDWEIAVARARATAEPPPVPRVAPPAPVAAPSLRAVPPPIAARPALPLPPPPPSPPTEQRARTIIAVPALPAADPQALRHYDSATRRGLPAPRRLPRATNHGTARTGSSRH
jgi:hypothetical protein